MSEGSEHYLGPVVNDPEQPQWQYWKQGEFWHKRSEYVDTIIRIPESKVPEAVKREWEKSKATSAKKDEGGGKTAESSSKAPRYLGVKGARPPAAKKNTRPSSSAQQQTSAMPTTSSKPLAVSKVTPAQPSRPTKQQHLNPNLITTSDMLVQKTNTALRGKMDDRSYQQLQRRLEVRKMIMDPDADGQDTAAASALKPFNPNGLGPIEVVKRRSAAHADLSEEAGEIMTQLLNADAEYEKLKYRKFDTKRIYTPMVGRLNSKQGESIKMEDLAEFQERNNLSILNIDRFITATDRRKPIYDAGGNCIFCQTHGAQNSGQHSDDAECPYTFCACVQCYLNAGLSEAKLQG